MSFTYWLGLMLGAFPQKPNFQTTSAMDIHPPYRIFYTTSMSFCTKSAVRSIEAVADVMEYISGLDHSKPIEGVDIQSVLDELQNIVVQGAAVSRYFWPLRNGHEVRANTLKKQFNVTEDNPLRMSKPLRDAIEHFDERLDKYISNGIVGQIFPHYFGYDVPRDGVPVHFFRAYFINNGVFEILGDRFEIEPMANELFRLNDLLEATS